MINLVILHNYISPKDCTQMNEFLKNNGCKWLGHGTDLETGLQDSGYIVHKNADLNKIKSYSWPTGVISAEFRTYECDSDLDTDEEFGIPHRNYKQ